MPPFEKIPYGRRAYWILCRSAFIVQDRGLDLDTRKYLSPVVPDISGALETRLSRFHPTSVVRQRRPAQRPFEIYQP